MLLNKLSTLFLCLFLSFGTTSVYAQNSTPINFKSGVHIPGQNIDKFIAENTTPEDLVNGYYYRLIQFNKIPTIAQKENLKKAGINLLNYIPNHSFYAAISQSANLKTLKNTGALSIEPIAKRFKLTPKLNRHFFDEWALDGTDKVSLNGIYFDGVSKEFIHEKLVALGAEILMENDAQTVRFKINIKDLPTYYKLSEFYYFEQIEAPSQPENLVGATNHRSNTLATAYSNGLKYDGTGVTVMLQDNSVLDQHIDYTGRFANFPSAAQTGDHGEHCGGIIAGAGNLDPIGRGMAYGSDVLVFNWTNNNFNDVPDLYANNNLTITSKSYGDGVNAGYTSLTRQLDRQTRMMPELIHIFSCGNSNSQGFTAAGSQWFNITGGHKSGKNVIAVGNLNLIDNINSSSSRGPSEDGRIKPDICAVGTDVMSTIDPNLYELKSGTSMACPGVAGIMAQLYHAYKDLNGGVTPASGLMKATILNTADDLGNDGPDFIYGWGRINARNAFNLLSNHQYIVSSASQGETNVHSITIPPNTEQVKVMVYWTDYEASPSSSTALVNNIDIELNSPNGATYGPWVLNSTPNSFSLNQPAQRGSDNLNNMEQVSIEQPTPGVYNLSVNGTAIPQGPQTYYVVYEFISNEVVLTYPIGGEGLNSFANERIRWDAFGNAGNFELEFSENNGASWSSIASNIPASVRSYDWNTPNIITGKGLIRISRGNVSSQSHEQFSIIRVPIGLKVNWVCDNYMEVAWSSLNGATGYEVSVLGSKYMEPAGTTSNTTLVIPTNGDTWWSVKALGPDNCVGRRARAKFQSGGQFNCSISKDISATSKESLDGRQLMSCMTADLPVSISVKNLGQNAVSNVPVFYQLNSNGPISETITGSIAQGDSSTHTFQSQISPTNGNNTLKIWSALSGDQISVNDTITFTFSVINSDMNKLPLVEDFESFALCGTNNNCELEICETANGFINESNGIVDDLDWRTNEGETPALNTGPSKDFNPGTNEGNYMYIETSADVNCSNKEAHLILPCVDLTKADVASLEFAYHMFGEDIGALHVDLYMNGAWTNDIMPAIVGNKGQNWLKANVNLTNFTGHIINIRLRGTTGTGIEGNMAIDDIRVSGSGADDNLLDFSIYPNPSTGLYNFDYRGLEDLSIEVHDVNGKLIHKSSLKGGEYSPGLIDITSHETGVYVITLTNNSDRLIQKVVKQ